MSIYLAMCLYAISMSLSPGPVNLLALSAGVNQGLSKSVPFVAGASLGFILLFFLVGLGLGQLMTLIPELMQALKIAGIGFMMYVSYLLFNASGKLAKLSNYNATFWQGAIMQWLNPKAWMASMAAVSAFELNVFEHLLVFCLIYLLVCFLCILCWAGAGNFLQHWFTHGNRLNAFNKTMALILAMVALVILVM